MRPDPRLARAPIQGVIRQPRARAPSQGSTRLNGSKEAAREGEIDDSREERRSSRSPGRARFDARAGRLEDRFCWLGVGFKRA